LIGERWSFLILRGAFNGLQHFEQFQAGLGIARNILSNRLARLVKGGILERRSDPSDRRKVIYSLSPKGEALLPVLIALRQWGEDWGHGSPDIVLADQRDGRRVRRIRVQAADGRDLKLSELIWIDRYSGRPLKSVRQD
jgi:DNA-binding HxlR family transcriptional regulator